MFYRTYIEAQKGGPARKALFVSLAVFVCLYSFGLCFCERHGEDFLTSHGVQPCCECHGLCDGTTVPSGQPSCRHHHGHDGFHLHKMAPMLPHQGNRDILMSVYDGDSRVDIATLAISGHMDMGIERGQSFIPAVLSPAALSLPEQNLPLLL